MITYSRKTLPRHTKSDLGEKVGAALTWVAVLYLIAWLVGWLLQRKWGAILIAWLLWYFGAMLILGGLLTLVTGDAGLFDEAWPWLFFGAAATVITAIQWNLGQK